MVFPFHLFHKQVFFKTFCIFTEMSMVFKRTKQTSIYSRVIKNIERRCSNPNPALLVFFFFPDHIFYPYIPGLHIFIPYISHPKRLPSRRIRYLCSNPVICWYFLIKVNRSSFSKGNTSWFSQYDFIVWLFFPHKNLITGIRI